MLVGAIQIEKQSDPSVCNLRGLGQSQKLVISTEGRNLLLLLPVEKQISSWVEMTVGGGTCNVRAIRVRCFSQNA